MYQRVIVICLEVKPGTVVRVRVRGRVVRVRVSETRVRTVVRVAAHGKDTHFHPQPISLLKPIAITATAQCHAPGKGIQFADFAEDVLNILGAREELPRLRIRLLGVVLDKHKRLPVRAFIARETRAHRLVVAHPEGGIDKAGLLHHVIRPALVGRVAGYAKEGEAPIIAPLRGCETGAWDIIVSGGGRDPWRPLKGNARGIARRRVVAHVSGALCVRRDCAMEAKPGTEGRARVRGRVDRVRASETRVRTVGRAAAHGMDTHRLCRGGY